MKRHQREAVDSLAKKIFVKLVSAGNMDTAAAAVQSREYATEFFENRYRAVIDHFRNGDITERYALCDILHLDGTSGAAIPFIIEQCNRECTGAGLLSAYSKMVMGYEQSMGQEAIERYASHSDR